jgi:tetratricopeptide (TPR) repeat protein
MRTPLSSLLAVTAMLAMPLAWSAATGPIPASPLEEISNVHRGKASYNEALEVVKEADAYDATGANAKEAEAAYRRARKKFQEATTWAPDLAEAWNGVGYTQRKLGSYIAALSAYEQALKIRPGFPEAIEYRGEAYLGLNRIEDAKQTYLELFDVRRALADKLLISMHAWIQAQRAATKNVDVAALTDFEKWVNERPPPLSTSNASSSWGET